MNWPVGGRMGHDLISHFKRPCSGWRRKQGGVCKEAAVLQAMGESGLY